MQINIFDIRREREKEKKNNEYSDTYFYQMMNH